MFSVSFGCLFVGPSSFCLFVLLKRLWADCEEILWGVGGLWVVKGTIDYILVAIPPIWITMLTAVHVHNALLGGQ